MKIIQVEISKGSKLKIENNRLDRIVKFSFPVNYGYIENSIAEDGDEVDAVILSKYSYPSGIKIKEQDLNYFGELKLKDSNQQDNKLIFYDSSLKGQSKEILYNLEQYVLFLRYYKNSDVIRLEKLELTNDSKKIIDEIFNNFNDIKNQFPINYS